ncbi:redoxin domain-containing protein [Sphingobacterium sp. InxBP1]|uniref:TlpA family protein disulfide reductase n=1 Tax=Sphingobacterium sp. InxBP1 TaxID=2870328 RepID=UPI002244D0D3|nr:SCO family protein [Sphingobacterium sp. InxBP1]MCW8313494.1 redoxin domain-containing protein [Sphingobacterium sp. InxBP1]
MKTIYIALLILSNMFFVLSAQTKTSFTIDLQGFDEYDHAVATIQRLDEEPDMLVEELELTNGYVAPLVNGGGKITVDNVPDHFIMSLNFYIKESKYRFITNWYVNRTDSIAIKNNRSKNNFDRVTFCGRESALFDLQYKLDGLIWNRVDYSRYAQKLSYFKTDLARSFDYERVVDCNIEVGRLVHGSAVETAAKQWILMNMFYKLYYSRFIKPLFVSFKKNDPKHRMQVKELLDIFRSHYLSAIHEKKALSTDYITFYLYYRALEAKCFPIDNLVDYRVKQLQHDFQNENLEKMAYAYLAGSFYFMNTDDRLKVLNWISSISKSPRRLAKLEEMKAIAPGMPFPEFELTDLSGKRWRKNELQGKVVFFDFYYTGCSNCAKYYQFIVSKAEEHFFNNPDIVFVSISIDKKMEVWRKSVESGQYNSEGSLKLYTNGMGEAHPLIKDLRIVGYPFPIIMGRTGLIETSDSSLLGIGASKADGLISTINRALGQ